MRRVTADSNIYISALQFGGEPLEFLNQARNGEIELAISDAILDEFTRILRDKFKWSEEKLRDLRGQIPSFTNCSGFLSRTIEIVDPRVIVTLGSVALDAIISLRVMPAQMSRYRSYAWSRGPDKTAASV